MNDGNQKDIVLQIGLGNLLLIVFTFTMFFAGGMFLFFEYKSAGEYGDSFGILNTLFAGFAFAAFLIALSLQRKELEETREVLKKSADTQHIQAQVYILLEEIKYYEKWKSDDLEVFIKSTPEKQLSNALNYCMTVYSLNTNRNQLSQLSKVLKGSSMTVSGSLDSKVLLLLKNPDMVNKFLLLAKEKFKEENAFFDFQNFVLSQL